jgi:hypothetical protein
VYYHSGSTPYLKCKRDLAQCLMSEKENVGWYGWGFEVDEHGLSLDESLIYASLWVCNTSSSYILL